MKIRIITGLILAITFLPVLYIGGMLFNALAAVFASIFIYEILNVYSKEKKISLIGVMIISMLTYLVMISTKLYFSHNELNYIVIIQISVVLVLLSLSVFDKIFDIKEVSKAFLLVYYIGYGTASIMILRDAGLNLLIFVFAIIIATDVFAYLTGMFIGKNKLAPHISPKKTIEGSIGGLILGSGIGIVTGLSLGINEVNNLVSEGVIEIQLGLLIVIAITISLLGQIGDLVASRIKREYGAKDFSKLLPGHGGLLDRFDSMIFASIGLVMILNLLGI